MYTSIVACYCFAVVRRIWSRETAKTASGTCTWTWLSRRQGQLASTSIRMLTWWSSLLWGRCAP